MDASLGLVDRWRRCSSAPSSSPARSTCSPIGIAFALGGVAAWLGASMPSAAARWPACSASRSRSSRIAGAWRSATPPPQPSLDIGQSVQRAATGTPTARARVDYRGTQWDAELATPDTPRAETMYIVGTRGSTLRRRRPPRLTVTLNRMETLAMSDRLVARSRSRSSSSRSSSSSRRSASCRSSTRWVVERLGRFHAVLQPGLNFVIPFVDRVAYRHDLREIPLDVPQPDLHHQGQHAAAGRRHPVLPGDRPEARVATARRTTVVAITQLAQTTLRSVIGRMELDKTFEERDQINASVVAALDQAAANWGVKVLRYEIKDLTPPAEILRAMQAQITAEREKRAVIATSEGKQQEQINLADGAREAAIAKSRRREAGRDQPGAGPGAGDPRRSPRRTPRRSARSAEAIDGAGRHAGGQPQGRRAVRRRVRQPREDQQHADRAGERRRPRGLIATAMTVVQGAAATVERADERRGTDMQLAGSTFVVTGGASGLGAGDRAHARRRAAATSSSPISRKTQGRRSRRELGGRARFVRTDVTDEASAKAAVAAAVDGVRRPAGARQLRRHRPRREGRRQGRRRTRSRASRARSTST